ncbi:uncharacterized protein LOC144173322 [Haemaphysalis longicornis]
MAVKTEPYRFQSVDEVALQPALRPLIWKDTIFEAYIKASPRPSLRALTQQAYRHNGFLPITEMFSAASSEQLYSGRAVIVSDSHVTMHMLAQQCRLTGGDLYLAPELLFSRFCGPATAKHLPPALQRRIDSKVRAMVDSGLNVKWYSDSLREWQRCRAMQGADSSQDFSYRALQFKHTAAVFALWAMTAALSLLVFGIELCVHGNRAHVRLAHIGARRRARHAGRAPGGSPSSRSRGVLRIQETS